MTTGGYSGGPTGPVGPTVTGPTGPKGITTAPYVPQWTGEWFFPYSQEPLYTEISCEVTAFKQFRMTMGVTQSNTGVGVGALDMSSKDQRKLLDGAPCTKSSPYYGGGHRVEVADLTFTNGVPTKASITRWDSNNKTYAYELKFKYDVTLNDDALSSAYDSKYRYYTADLSNRLGGVAENYVFLAGEGYGSWKTTVSSTIVLFYGSSVRLCLRSVIARIDPDNSSDVKVFAAIMCYKKDSAGSVSASGPYFKDLEIGKVYRQVKTNTAAASVEKSSEYSLATSSLVAEKIESMRPLIRG